MAVQDIKSFIINTGKTAELENQGKLCQSQETSVSVSPVEECRPDIYRVIQNLTSLPSLFACDDVRGSFWGPEYRLQQEYNTSFPLQATGRRVSLPSFITEDLNFSLNFLCLRVADDTFKIILQTPKSVKGSLPILAA